MPPVGKLGFRILSAPPRLTAAVIAAFRELPATAVADAMGRFNFMDPGIRPRTGLRLYGPAVTVNCRPGDHLMVHKALQIAEPGDIIVVCTGGNITSAVFGDLMCHAAVVKGIGGIVVDGAIRDTEGLAGQGFPAFSRSVCAGSCDKDGPGEINVPISCGGTVVAPGDIIVGDADGVAVVPRDHAVEVLALVTQFTERENARIAEIHGGMLFTTEIDETLRKHGVIE